MKFPDLPTTKPIHGTPAEAYLRRRGVWCDLAAETRALRYGMEYMGRRDCHVLYAGLRDTQTNEPCSYQRIFITEDGERLKGWNGNPDEHWPRMLARNLGDMRAKGCAVMLSDFESVGQGLTLCEGIECALAVARHWQRTPVWAVTGAGFMSSFEPPTWLKSLTIMADHDKGGLLAADTLFERLVELQIECLVIHSPIKGEDAEDYVRRVEAQ